MPIRVRISYRNPKHYLIATLTMTMQADGAELPQVKSGAFPSKAGAIRFDIPDGTKDVTLKIEIPKHNAASVASILEIVQHFKVVEGKPPRLDPFVFDGPPFMADGPKLYHPRLSEPATAGSGKGKLFELVLDTRFLRVTDFARSTGKLNIQLGREWQPPKGSRVVVLEDTFFPGAPVVWYVLIPPALDSTQSRINVLMFYRPEILNPTYTDLRDIQEARFLRYVDDPPDGAPFFIDGASFTSYPRCAFERQLVQSGKRVLMAFPMPHVTSYGLAEGPNAPATLRRFVKTLWMEGEVGGRADDKAELGRVAVSGFSSGGNTALQAIKDFGNSIDELYLFDPGVFKGSERLKPWLAGKSGRKLCMIAGGYSQSGMASLGLPGAMINSTSVDFWFTDLTYLKALSVPGGPIEAFDHLATAQAASAATTPATIATGLFRVVAPDAALKSPIVLQGRFQDAKGAHSTPLHRVAGGTLPSEVEAASFAHFGRVKPLPKPKPKPVNRPIQSDDDVAAVADAIVNQGKPEPDRIRALRHSWASCGGTSANGTRTAADYKGYLQSCLERSSF